MELQSKVKVICTRYERLRRAFHCTFAGLHVRLPKHIAILINGAETVAVLRYYRMRIPPSQQLLTAQITDERGLCQEALFLFDDH